MFRGLLGGRKNKRKKEAAAQLISVKELAPDSQASSQANDNKSIEEDPTYDSIPDPGDKRLSINGLSSFRAPDVESALGISEKEDEPLYATVNKGEKSKEEELGDLSAFIESIVADMDVGSIGDTSEESSSEEMKSFGNKVKPKKGASSRQKAVSEPNVAVVSLDNHITNNEVQDVKPVETYANQQASTNVPEKEVVQNHIHQEPSFPTTGPLLQNRAASGIELNRSLSLSDSAEYHFDVRPKKCVSFNDVVQERPQSMVSDENEDPGLGKKNGESESIHPSNDPTASVHVQPPAMQHPPPQQYYGNGILPNQPTRVSPNYQDNHPQDYVQQNRTNPQEQHALMNGNRVSPTSPYLHNNERSSPNGHHMHPSGHRMSPSGPPLLVNGMRISPSGQLLSPNGLLMLPSGHRMSPHGHPIYMGAPNGRRRSSDVMPNGQRMSPHHHMKPNGYRLSPNHHAMNHHRMYPNTNRMLPNRRRMSENIPTNKHPASRRPRMSADGFLPLMNVPAARQSPRMDTELSDRDSPRADAEVLAITSTVTMKPDEDCVSVASEEDVYSESDEEDPPPPPPVKVKMLRKTRAAFLIITWFAMGLFSQTPGVGLPFLMTYLDITFEPIARTFLARGGGLVLGSIAGAALSSCVIGHLDAVMVLGLILGAGAVVLTPWCPSLLYMCGAVAGDGAARGIISVGGILYAVRLWGEEKGCLIIHLLHISMATAAAILPQIIRPLFEDSNSEAIEKYLQTFGIDDLLRANGYHVVLNGSQNLVAKETVSKLLHNTTISEDYDVAQEIIPKLIFLILGLFLLLLALIFIGLSCYNRIQSCRKTVGESRMTKYEEQRLLAKIEADRKEQEKEKQKEINGMVNGSLPQKDEEKTDQTEGGEPETETKPDAGEGVNESSHESDVTIELSNGNATHDSDLTEKDTGEKEDGEEKASNGQAVSFDVNEDEQAKKEAKAEKAALKRKKKKAKKLSRTKWFQGEQTFDVPMLMYLYVFFSLPMGAEVTMGNFLYAYARESRLKMTPVFASFLLSIFWALMAISRIFTLMMSKCIAPNAFMVAILTLNLVSSSLLAAYGDRILSVLWLLTAMYGASLGPIIPGGFTWANIYLNYTPKAIALAFCLAAFGAVLFSWLTGLLVDFYGITVLMYVMVCISAMSLILYIPAMRGLGVRKMFRVKMKKTKDMVFSNSQKTYL